ncbi:hypothetical protein VVD49_07345 [Uliginosibacterium sp. H3]|uniref:Uncharacterized protein n=1 Tax=Uliginosibacterium silvisoli TaxID=3114758 RepID=A0ABU6K0S4_9RHOO|nr:hypothetical protein [Uliginosibacterium sp. H3]
MKLVHALSPAMDALSSLSAISPLVAPATVTAVAANRAATETSAAPEASVQTIFSDFARQLLAQQNTSTNRGINDALARNLLSPTLSYVAGGQLYTSAGLLQQYATSQFLSQLENNRLDQQADGSTTLESTGFSFLGNSSSRSIRSILDAYEQVSLLGGLSFIGGKQTSNPTDTTAPQPVVRSSSAYASTSVEASA